MDYRKNPALAQSDLRDLIEKSPQHFYYKRYDDRYVPQNTPALLQGSALHTIALEEELFLKRYVRGLEIDKRSAANKAEHAEQEELAKKEGKEILPPAVWDLCYNIKKEFDENPVLNQFKESSLIEQEIYFDMDGVDCKAKLDIVNPQEGFIVDFKTTLDAGKKFERDIFNIGYHRQLAWYREAARKEYGTDFRCYIFAQEKEQPYAYAMYELSETALELGLHDMQLALELFKLYETNGYPTYNGGHIKIVEPPIYLLNKN
jgi:hypothetical protein